MAISIEEKRKRDRDYRRMKRATKQGYQGHRLERWHALGIKIDSYALFLAILEKQAYTCAICHCPIDESCPLDHNHETGLPRGVLCQVCNLLEGIINRRIANCPLNIVEMILAYRYATEQ